MCERQMPKNPRFPSEDGLMDMSRILLIGATGMVGRTIVRAAGDRPLTLLARREVDDLADRHALLVAPSARWPDILAAERPATLICCLGTTNPQAGAPPAFRAVDRDLRSEDHPFELPSLIPTS